MQCRNKAEGEGRGVGGDAPVGVEPHGTEPRALLGLGFVVKTPVEHGTVACSQDSVLGFPRTRREMIA